jgi:acyl-coenzyme A thioesterase PaaI-like protein
MKKQFSTLFVLGTMCFLASCQKETVMTTEIENKSNSANAKMKEEGVPFKGEYTTVAEFLRGPAVQRITGTGHATHLGKSVFVANATVNLTTPPPFAIAGTAVFTAANGDQFYTRFTGTNTPTGNGTSRGVLYHTITGGTGRFENATGSFTGIALVNAASPTNSVSFDGHINF